ncbi:RNA polymerase sigma factor [Sorangium sp. So ce1128]
MDKPQQQEVEQEIRRRIDAGDAEAASTAALRGYGRELYTFLAAIHREEQEAAEVFSLLSEAIWRGLPRFGWQSSFRTWAYSVARKLSLAHRRGERRRAARFAPWPEGSTLPEIAAQVRTETQAALRTERRSRFTALRETLAPEDQELLILRVDRNLAWNDLAQVLRAKEHAEPLEGEALKREAARLRKRFQTVKEKLYELARREGLLEPDREP